MQSINSQVRFDPIESMTTENDAVFSLDLKGFIQSYNTEAGRLLDLEVISHYGQPLLSGLSKRLDIMSPELFTHLKSLSNGDRTVSFRTCCHNAGEAVIWYEWRITSVIAEGKIYGFGRNITESRNLEKKIEAERRRFFDMFHEAPVSMAILKGPDLVFETANEAYYRFFDKGPGIIGQSVYDVFPEAAGQGPFEQMKKVYQTGEMFAVNETPLQLNNNNGLKCYYLSYMFQAYRNAEDEIEGIFYFGVDVTEQVLARNKIYERKRQYIDLIQNLPVPVYKYDKEGYIQLYNKAAAAFWGCEPVIGVDKWCGSNRFQDQNGQTLLFSCSPMAKVLAGYQWQQEEIKLTTAKGEVRDVIPFPSAVVDSQGEVTGAINVIIDITERKKTEEKLNRLSLIARKTVNGVIITTSEGIIDWVNDGFLHITGYQHGEVVGKKPLELLAGDKTDQQSIRNIGLKKQQLEPFEYEMLFYNSEDKQFWVELQGQPIFDQKGRLTHYFEMLTDVSERKAAFIELEKKEQEIRNFARDLNNMLEEQRTRIAREIHDEFGQQLSGLKLSLFSLKSKRITEGQSKEIVDDMMKGVDNTIKSLRSFSTELRPLILDTLGLVPSIEWLATEFKNKSGILCTVTARIDQEVFSREISIALFRICQEALTNITRHANASQVYITLVQVDAFLSLTIEDNGIGIQSEKLENPFSMGLISMKERANLLGGELRIFNRNNKGTTVQLSLEINE